MAPRLNKLTLTGIFALAGGLLAAQADKAAQPDPLDVLPSLFEMPPEEVIPSPTPVPQNLVSPFDPRLETLRRWDQVNKSKEFPDLPQGDRIEEIGLLREDSEEGEVQRAIQNITFGTLMREAQEKSKAENLEGAIKTLEDGLPSLEIDSLKFRAHQRLGLLYYQLAIRGGGHAMFETAAMHMETALELAPNRGTAVMSSLAGLYLYLGDVKKALATLSRINPDLIFDDRKALFALHFNYACAYSLNNEPEKAVSHLEQAATQDPAVSLSSLGDPQLDNIRDSAGYKRLERRLKEYVLNEEQPEKEESSN